MVKLHAVESNKLRLDGGAMFGNAPKTMWNSWTRPDKDNRIHLATRTLLVQTDDEKNFLFEVGVGAFFEPKLKDRFGVEEEEHMLLKNLSKIGVDETDIDGVILSHLHFDHAGGLLPEYGDNVPMLHFPNANYYLPEKHWEYAQNPHPRERTSFIPILQELLEKSDRLVLIDKPEHKELDFGVTFRFSDGHTKGLMISRISLKSGPLIFVTDLVPGLSWVHLPITMGYDRFPELKSDEKKQLFEDILDKNAILFFTHDPKIPCALLKRDEKGRYFGEPVNLDQIVI